MSSDRTTASDMSKSKEDDHDDGDVLLTAIGNPNLDVNVMVEDAHFFTQHDIPVDGHTQVSVEFMAALEHDLKRYNYKTMYFPGGCAQNTVRVFQWLIDAKFRSCMIGSVGTDENAQFLRNQLEKDGVKECYSVISNCRTTSIYIFVYKNSRSAVYNREGTAASVYSIRHLRDHPNALPSIRNSKIVLTEGFFTEHSANVALEALCLCVELGIVTVFNLSGRPVLEQHFEKAIDPFVRGCDVVVGNLEEFDCLRAKLRIRSEESTKEAAISVHNMMMSSHKSCRAFRVRSMERYKKILIVTNGVKDVLCVTDCDGLVTYAVPRLESGHIKDTTGAGDAFLAGFLYALSKEQSISKCLEMACHVAGQIVRQYGTTLPESKIDFPN